MGFKYLFTLKTARQELAHLNGFTCTVLRKLPDVDGAPVYEVRVYAYTPDYTEHIVAALDSELTLSDARPSRTRIVETREKEAV